MVQFVLGYVFQPPEKKQVSYFLCVELFSCDWFLLRLNGIPYAKTGFSMVLLVLSFVLEFSFRLFIY